MVQAHMSQLMLKDQFAILGHIGLRQNYISKPAEWRTDILYYAQRHAIGHRTLLATAHDSLDREPAQDQSYDHHRNTEQKD